MDRTGDRQAVRHTQRDRCPLAPPENGPGKQPVDRCRTGIATRQIDRRGTDDQIKFVAAKHLGVAKVCLRWGLSPGAEVAQERGSSNAFDKRSA